MASEMPHKTLNLAELLKGSSPEEPSDNPKLQDIIDDAPTVEANTPVRPKMKKTAFYHIFLFI